MCKIDKYENAIASMMMVRQSVNGLGEAEVDSRWSIILNGEVTSQSTGTSFSYLQKVVSAIKQQINGFIAIDYEGGRICRWEDDMPSLPSALVLSLIPEHLERAGEIMGAQLTALGISMVLGPVVDNGGAKSAFPYRCYGRDSQEITENVTHLLSGLNKHVWTCLKHYPNHGAVIEDSHSGLPECNLNKAELEERYLSQFYTITAASAVMTAHILVRQWDAEHPATFSSTILQTLRERIGDKLIITDSLTMEAIGNKYGSLTEIAKKAILAGCDMLITGRFSVNEVKKAQRELAEAAVFDKELRKCIKDAARRINRLKSNVLNPIKMPVDQIVKDSKDFTRMIAKQVLFKKYACTRALNLEETLIIAPMLLSQKIKDGCHLAFERSVDHIFWEGTSPKEEILSEILEKALDKHVIVFTTNGFRDKQQAELIERFSPENLSVCEVFADFDEMKWVPSGTQAVCTYSADPVSIGEALKVLSGQVQERV